MNTELEARLLNLKPAAPTSSLKARIALQLGPANVRSSPWKWLGTTGGMIAALCVVALLSRQPWPAYHAVATDDSPPHPTLWAYQNAYAQSPEELERCLDRDAAKLLVLTSEDLRMARLR